MSQFQGDVKWFNSKKGYGFITPKDSSAIGVEGKDVFVHYSDITGDGYRTLKEGDAVTFETAQGERGLKAVKVEAAAAQV